MIDDGCAFANENFQNQKGEPRVWYLWDQDPRRAAQITHDWPPVKWREVFGFGYGAELFYEGIKTAAMLDRAEPLTGYESIDYVPLKLDPDTPSTSLRPADRIPLPRGIMNRSTHGTGAMHLAAGHPSPLADQRAISSEKVRATAADYASAFPIVFVQLPTRTTIDTTGGSLALHVLDGVRYILDRADRIPYEGSTDPSEMTPPAPGGCHDAQEMQSPPGVCLDAEHAKFAHRSNRVVINISYGAIAGPHDGTSILEQALVDAVHGRSRTWIVVSAGNAHRSRTHSRLELRQGGPAKTLVWRVAPDNPLQSFLEIWFPSMDASGGALDQVIHEDAIVRVQPPGNLPVQQIRIGQMWCLKDDPGSTVEKQRGILQPVAAAGVFSRKVVQGTEGTMVLLAVGATRSQSGDDGKRKSETLHGDWAIEIGYIHAQETHRRLIVHAWTERNDLVYGNLRRQQSTVIGDDPIPDLSEYSKESIRLARDSGMWVPDEVQGAYQYENSMGSLAGTPPAPIDFWRAHGPNLVGNVVVVGGYRMADGEVASYSSGGPARGSIEDRGTRPAPEILARRDQRPTYRSAPDAMAPSDVSVSLRGIRVTGLRDRSTSRLGGTSAAAPTITRLIANLSHAEERDLSASSAGSFGATSRIERSSIAARPTPTPAQDDAFRNGKVRATGEFQPDDPTLAPP